MATIGEVKKYLESGSKGRKVSMTELKDLTPAEKDWYKSELDKIPADER